MIAASGFSDPMIAEYDPPAVPHPDACECWGCWSASLGKLGKPGQTLRIRLPDRFSVKPSHIWRQE